MLREYLYGKRLGIIRRHISELADLDVGAGKEKKGNLTIDILPYLKPDIVADIRFLPIKDATIKSVVCSHVIEHIDNPDNTVKEIMRILKNDGLIFFFIPDDKSILWRLLEPFWEIYYSKQVIKEATPQSHKSSFSYDSFITLLERNFAIVIDSGKINGGAEIFAVCRK